MSSGSPIRTKTLIETIVSLGIPPSECEIIETVVRSVRELIRVRPSRKRR